MISILEYIENSYDIKHTQSNDGSGMFKINKDSYLTYNSEVILTPTNKTENTIELGIIYTNQKRQGFATALLNRFIEYANEEKKDIVAYVSPMDSISEEDLIKLIKSFGFEKDKDSDDDHVYRKIYKE